MPGRRGRRSESTAPTPSSSARRARGRPNRGGPPRCGAGADGMFDYLVRRLLVMVPTMIAISIITFVIIQLPPGDYLSTLIAEMESQGENVDLGKKIGRASCRERVCQYV